MATLRPDSLFPNPEAYDKERSPIPDYDNDPFYEGVASLHDRIKMRGFREHLNGIYLDELFTSAYQESCVFFGMADLWGMLNWQNDAEEQPDEVMQKAQALADIKVGSKIALVPYESPDGYTECAFFDEGGERLPVEPGHDYDRLFFEHCDHVVGTTGELFCVVRDIHYIGEDHASYDPCASWRIITYVIEVFGRPF